MSQIASGKSVGLDSLEEVELELGRIAEESSFEYLSDSDTDENSEPPPSSVPRVENQVSKTGEAHLTIGQHVGEISRILYLYKRLDSKKHHNDPDCYQLFVVLHRFWKATNESVVDFSALGALIRAQNPMILEKFPQPQLKSFLRKMVKLKLPIRLNSQKEMIDIKPMIDMINKIEFNEEMDRACKNEMKNQEDATGSFIKVEVHSW